MVRSTVSEPRASSSPEILVRADTTDGAKISAITTAIPTTTSTPTSNVPPIRLSSLRCPNAGAAHCASTGISAACSAPLASRSKSRVWRLSAIVNAAISSPVPKRPAASCSRTSPSTRLSTLPSMRIMAARAIPPPLRGGAGCSLNGISPRQ